MSRLWERGRGRAAYALHGGFCPKDRPHLCTEQGCIQAVSGRHLPRQGRVGWAVMPTSRPDSGHSGDSVQSETPEGARETLASAPTPSVAQ